VPEDGAGATPQCNNATVVDWNDLRHLLALHRAGSLAKAGLLLRVDKATVGRRIEVLEAALGAALVERLPTGYRLTEEGLQAAEAAQAMAVLAGNLEASVGGRRERAQGSVRITAPAWFCRHVLIPALPALRASQPRIEIQLLTTNVVVSMPKREADIAIRNRRATERGLASRKLGELASALYGARSYLARQGQPPSRRALGGYHLLSYQDQLTYVPGFQWLKQAGAPVAFRASDTLALAEACVAGLGLAVLPCYIGSRDPALERVTSAGIASESIWLVVPQDLARQSAVRLTCQWLARLFADHQPELAGPGS
jgi:DNA-binding transcriptional LysR family regulator